MAAPGKPKAWIVPVWTGRHGGGEAMWVNYIAGFSDPLQAREAVRRHVVTVAGDDVKEPSALSDAMADSLQVRLSEVRTLIEVLKRVESPAQHHGSIVLGNAPELGK